MKKSLPTTSMTIRRARKYARLSDELIADLQKPSFPRSGAAAVEARAYVARASYLLAAAYCLLNDHTRGRI